MPTWEEYWGKGGINDKKIASGAGDAVKSTKPTTSSNSGSSTSYTNGLYGSYANVANNSGSSSSSPSAVTAPAATQTNKGGQAQLPSWMGNMYSNVPGTDYYSTNPSNPNASKYYADGRPVPSVSYDYTQSGGGKFDGYVSPEQFQQIMNADKTTTQGNQALQQLMESWVKNGQATSNQSIYGNNPTTAPPVGGLTSSSTYKQPMQQGTLTPLATTPTMRPGYVKNAEVDNMALEDQLKYYASNPEEAKQEVLRAKGIWEQNKNNPQAQANASAWAKMMRQAAGIAEDDAAYGSVDPQQPSGGTGGGTQQPVVDPNQQPPGPLGGVGEVINNNKPLTDELMGYFKDLMNGIGGGGTNNAALQQQAQQQAQAIFDQKKTQYQQLIDSLKSGQANDLKNVTNQTEQATSELEDKTFQKWLESRQNVANRGLASSGASSEADTRLLLSRQKDLGNLYNTQANAANNINRSYTDKLNSAQATLAGNNLGQTQAEIFSKLFKDSQGSMSDQLKAVTDLLSKQFGYSQINPADYLKNSANIYATNAKTKLAYDKMDQQDRQFYDNLAQQNKELGLKAIQWQNDYGLKAAQIFGQDANGNPTLDARKMAAEMALKREQLDVQRSHNRVTESQGWARINQSDQQMQIKLQDMQNRANQFNAQMQNTAYKDQASALSQIMDTESKNMIDARKVLNNKNSTKEAIDTATTAYNKAAAKIESTQTILTDISKLPKGTLGDTGRSGNYDISDLPDDLGDFNFMGG